MRTELWGLRNTETQELVLTYWASSQKHKALFSTREKAEDACKHNPQYEPFRIEAEPVKHGRWVHPKGYVVSNGFLCSECNHEEASYHVIHPLGNGSCRADEHGNFYYPPKINYCPNCGAKMDRGADHD